MDSQLLSKPYSSDENDLNIRSHEFLRRSLDWLDMSRQNDKGEYPVFRRKCTIEKMENLPEYANLSRLIVRQVWRYI